MEREISWGQMQKMSDATSAQKCLELACASAQTSLTRECNLFNDCDQHESCRDNMEGTKRGATFDMSYKIHIYTCVYFTDGGRSTEHYISVWLAYARPNDQLSLFCLLSLSSLPPSSCIWQLHSADHYLTPVLQWDARRDWWHKTCWDYSICKIGEQVGIESYIRWKFPEENLRSLSVFRALHQTPVIPLPQSHNLTHTARRVEAIRTFMVYQYCTHSDLSKFSPCMMSFLTITTTSYHLYITTIFSPVFYQFFQLTKACVAEMSWCI